jgi:hypothetical protein
LLWKCRDYTVERGRLTATGSARRAGATCSIDPRANVLLAETVRDIANIAAGAMVFGQLLGDQMFSLWTAGTGSLLWIGFVVARNETHTGTDVRRAAVSIAG